MTSLEVSEQDVVRRFDICRMPLEAVTVTVTGGRRLEAFASPNLMNMVKYISK